MRTEKEIIAAVRQYLNNNKGKVLGFDGDCDATEDDAIQLLDSTEVDTQDIEKTLETLPNWSWEPNPVLVIWDWKEQPNWSEIISAIQKFDKPIIFEIDTAQDAYAIVIGPSSMTQKDADSLWNGAIEIQEEESE